MTPWLWPLYETDSAGQVLLYTIAAGRLSVATFLVVSVADASNTSNVHRTIWPICDIKRFLGTKGNICLPKFSMAVVGCERDLDNDDRFQDLTKTGVTKTRIGVLIHEILLLLVNRPKHANLRSNRILDFSPSHSNTRQDSSDVSPKYCIRPRNGRPA